MNLALLSLILCPSSRGKCRLTVWAQIKEICVQGCFLMMAEDDRNDEEIVCEKARMLYLVVLLLMTSLFEQALVALFYWLLFSPPPISLCLLLTPPSPVLLIGCKGGIFWRQQSKLLGRPWTGSWGKRGHWVRVLFVWIYVIFALSLPMLLWFSALGSSLRWGSYEGWMCWLVNTVTSSSALSMCLFTRAFLEMRLYSCFFSYACIWIFVWMVLTIDAYYTEKAVTILAVPLSVSFDYMLLSPANTRAHYISSDIIAGWNKGA